ncbi:MAG TPA: IS256 family transposase [Candidatus Dormibacteraeota bacterium]|nr:IS256 family transposase [Candidatus Dormibacteraeota bacterium]
MEKHTVNESRPSTLVWASLEERFRQQVQSMLQELLEEEVTEFLGRVKSERRPAGATAGTAAAASRNGHGKPRQLSTGLGTLTVQRPRVRGLEERFESRVLPLFARRTAAVDDLLPQLYLHGLAAGDFDLALRGLLGEEAPLSPSTMLRLKSRWQGEYEAWNQRSLAEEEVVYLWADGIYVKAGLEKEKACLLVVVAALADGRKVLLAVQSGYRESTESWAALLRDLKRRGMNSPRLVIADGNLGLWAALAQVYPEAGEQRCWNHRIVNVLDQVPEKRKGAAQVWLQQMMYAETREKAGELKGKFATWCDKYQCGAAARRLEEDWERLVAYYDFPQAHWIHLRTTNPVESPFAAARLRTSAAKRFKRVENATAMLWKLLRVAETRFRKVNAPELMATVAAGARYENGRLQRPEVREERIAA